MLYIHQFPDWTHFGYDAKRIFDALGKTRLSEGKLIASLQICGGLVLENDIIAEDIVANYAIDGIELDLENVKKQVELRSHGNLNFAKNYMGAIQNSSSPLSLERLFNWHASMAQSKAPQFRTGDSSINVAIGDETFSFTGPGPERLQAEIANFITWLEIAPMDGVIKAAIAHFWFLSLRPFNEANGRLARTLTAMQLARAEHATHCFYALSPQILEHRDEYIRILSRTQSGNGDLTEWILWFLKQMQAAIASSETRIQPYLRRFEFMSLHAGASLNEREQKLINAVFTSKIPRDFTAKDASALFGTSHDTALREIQSLISKGIIKPNSEGGRSQKYTLVE